MLKVLIVEDDPMVRMLTVKFIRSLNKFHLVGDFGTSSEALDYFKSNDADLLILDMFLPDMRGLELLKELRKKEIWCDVIFVTASNSSKDIEQAFHLGITDYLVKPFSFDRLKESLDRCIAINENFRSKKELTQREIDKYHLIDDSNTTDSIKGIQNSTLTKILNIITGNPSHEWSVREVSDKSDISIVTVKKYLDHLVKTGRITSHLCYKSVGRPQFLYKFIL